MERFLIAICLVVCGGCSSGGARCVTNADCRGLSCVQGECISPVPDGGSVLDGSLSDAGTTPADAGTSGDAGSNLDAGPADAGLLCATDAQCGAPSSICVGGRCVAGCSTTGCGAGRTCNGATGRCDGGCASDNQCGPPDTVCDGTQCVPGCTIIGCPLQNQTCGGNGRCTGCGSDTDCAPPSTVCIEGGCLPGCSSTGCGAGQSCSPTTGRCEAQLTRVLGADCTTDADCDSGVCLPLSVAGASHAVCSRLCCSEGQCPASDPFGQRFGCIEFYGANYCVTDRIFASSGVRFERSAGQPCGPGPTDNWCRSGLCRTDSSSGTRVCRATCCRNADCGALTCSFRPPFSPGEFSHHVCELALIGGTTGDTCFSEFDCISLVCVPLPSLANPVCADTCCTAADCPQGYSCVQIESGPSGSSNVGSVCLPSGGGAQSPGSSCTTGAFPNECASDVCVLGTCRQPCCGDEHCPSGQVCRAIDNGEPLSGGTRTGEVRVCVSP